MAHRIRINYPLSSFNYRLSGTNFVNFNNSTTWFLSNSFLNKKLPYREEHSASVVLSWCTLWHLSGDKQQSNSYSTTCTKLAMKPTEFREITQNNGHYNVQGRSRSPILLPIESPYTTSYYWLIVTDLLSCTISKLRLIICKILARDSRALRFNALAGGDSLRISP